MADETKLAAKQLRGQDAKALLENPLFKEVWEWTQDDIMKAWMTCKAEDKELRENLWIMQRLNRAMRQHFVTLVANGKHAASELIQIAKDKKPPPALPGVDQ